MELIEAASNLFMGKGLDNTSVNDIVKAVNVAQGTFYYHFKSKDEIIEAVVDNGISALIDKLEAIASDVQLEPARRVNKLIYFLFRFANSTSWEFQEYIHMAGNKALHDKISEKVQNHFVPILARVISMGVKNKRFDVKHPLETAEFIAYAINYNLHRNDFITASNQRRRRSCKTVEESVARVLGIKDYKFKLELYESR
ncbi:MAG: TetR/AcrR family transcriptional regulator [candidate division Zixibacteria bacterium]|nr:TetR/AcrR family transcriptional regulator [candidate division Zixibacteria bacterium]